MRPPWSPAARRLALLLLLAGLLAPGGPGLAQSDEGLTPDERRQRAKEERIRDYLERKEEKRLERLAREAEKRASGPGERSAPAGPREMTATETEALRERLPRGLARAQRNVASSSMGQDPTVQDYLARIDRQQADAEQLAAFANFVAQNGMPAEALEYYAVALDLEPRSSLMWTNLGTLQRQLGDLGGAMSSYARALRHDPNNAMAHYNVGAVLDAQGRYEEALEAYKIALRLDRRLGDTAYNPQAANNERLLAVKLMLYQDETGSLGLPLLEVPVERGPAEEAAPDEPPAVMAPPPGSAR